MDGRKSAGELARQRFGVIITRLLINHESYNMNETTNAMAYENGWNNCNNYYYIVVGRESKRICATAT